MNAGRLRGRRDRPDKWRGTGRTQRMLERARDAHDAGGEIVIVGASLEQTKLLERRFAQIAGKRTSRIRFLSASLGDRALAGVDPTTLVYVDHYVYTRAARGAESHIDTGTDSFLEALSWHEERQTREGR